MGEFKRQALVVGINRYPFLNKTPTGEPQHLTTAVRDAEAIAHILELYGGFEVTRLPSGLDDWQFEEFGTLKAEQLQAAITKLFCPKGGSIPDTALLFFAGVGLRQKYDNGETEGFLATSDSTPRKDNWGVSLKWLRKLLQESPVLQQIIWLDSSYSGELFNFTEIENKRDRCFITASTKKEIAIASNKRGLLTNALLQALDPKRTPDHKVTNSTIVNFIKATEFTLRSENETVTQHPDYKNTGNQIILTRILKPQSWLEEFKEHRLEKLWIETEGWFSDGQNSIQHSFSPQLHEESIREFQKVLKITDSIDFLWANETAAEKLHESIKSFCGDHFCGQKPTGNLHITMGEAYLIALMAYHEAWPDHNLEPLTRNVKNQWHELHHLKSPLLPLQKPDYAKASAMALYDLFLNLFKPNNYQQTSPQIEDAFFQENGKILKIFFDWNPNEKYYGKPSLVEGLHTILDRDREKILIPESASNAKHAILRLWKNMLVSKDGFMGPGTIYMGVNRSGPKEMGQLVLASVESL